MRQRASKLERQDSRGWHSEGDAAVIVAAVRNGAAKWIIGSSSGSCWQVAVGALLTAAVYLTQLKKVKNDLQTGHPDTPNKSQVLPDSEDGGPRRKSA